MRNAYSTGYRNGRDETVRRLARSLQPLSCFYGDVILLDSVDGLATLLEIIVCDVGVMQRESERLHKVTELVTAPDVGDP